MKKPNTPDSITPEMIAPCGMNCALCIGHRRERKPCAGCRKSDIGKPYHCVACRIKLCPGMKQGRRKFCFTCATFPCPRLRQLDKRYRGKYGMSMIENLGNISELGLKEFISRERPRWTCPKCGEVICVHRESCISCGRARER
jgi:hypothetical protein